jgi:hypothetical protein
MNIIPHFYELVNINDDFNEQKLNEIILLTLKD